MFIPLTQYHSHGTNNAAFAELALGCIRNFVVETQATQILQAEPEVCVDKQYIYFCIIYL